jgi:hypothetical protein
VILRARFAATFRREILPTPRVNEFAAGLQCAIVALFSFFCARQDEFVAARFVAPAQAVSVSYFSVPPSSFPPGWLFSARDSSFRDC